MSKILAPISTNTTWSLESLRLRSGPFSTKRLIMSGVVVRLLVLKPWTIRLEHHDSKKCIKHVKQNLHLQWLQHDRVFVQPGFNNVQFHHAVQGVRDCTTVSTVPHLRYRKVELIRELFLEIASERCIAEILLAPATFKEVVVNVYSFTGIWSMVLAAHLLVKTLECHQDATSVHRVSKKSMSPKCKLSTKISGQKSNPQANPQANPRRKTTVI